MREEEEEVKREGRKDSLITSWIRCKEKRGREGGSEGGGGGGGEERRKKG